MPTPHLIGPINMGLYGTDNYQCPGNSFSFSEVRGITYPSMSGFAQFDKVTGYAGYQVLWAQLYGGSDAYPPIDPSTGNPFGWEGKIRLGLMCGTSISFSLSGTFRPVDDLDQVTVKLNGTIVYQYKSNQVAGEAWFTSAYGVAPVYTLPGSPGYPTNPDDVFRYPISDTVTITLPTDRPCGNILEIHGVAGPGRYPADALNVYSRFQLDGLAPLY